MIYKPIGEVATLYKVSTQTIRRWVEEGKFEVMYTEGGHRRIKIKTERRILYARVSSRKQLSSIETQRKILCSKYPTDEFIFDIASGFNFNRRGLKKILELAFQGTRIEVVCTTQDRIARTGFSLIKHFVELSGGTINTIEEPVSSSERFDVEELIGFITSFINSHHGKRSARRRNDFNNSQDGDKTS